MVINVSNFKGIGRTVSLKDRPLSILTGSNSSGKTTIMQVYLLLKQSIESVDRDSALVLNKPYTSLGRFKNIIHNNDPKNVFNITFGLGYEDLLYKIKSGKKIIHPSLRRNLNHRNVRSIESISISIDFVYSKSLSRIVVKRFMVNVFFSENKLTLNIERVRTRYTVFANSDIFFDSWYRDKFFPDSYSNEERLGYKLTDLEDNEQFTSSFGCRMDFDTFFPSMIIDLDNDNLCRFSPFVSILKRILFERIRQFKYIGPLREAPKPYYFNDDDSIKGIGNKGQYAAHILAKLKDKEIQVPKLSDGHVFSSGTITLIEGVKLWLCKYFQMADNITVEKQSNESFYIIKLTNSNKNRVPINQVGFGVSQILPIIVQGLLLEEGDTLILEQPEIHLHPKVQSKLFDFLLGLVMNGRKIIVETHSDHLITRLRRRVAEDIIPNPESSIGLYFVGKNDNQLEYNLLSLDDMGNFSKWPKDFFDDKDEDLRAILKAQVAKRKKLK